jgi:leader peptidase (prepilin peptidase) / N-methyltransferase
VSVDLTAVLVCAASTAVLAAAGPAVMARLPEPEPDPVDAGRENADGFDPGAEPATDTAATVVPAGASPAPGPEPKILYADLAGRPGLVWKLALAGAVVGALVGGKLGFVAITPAWVYLGAVGVVLSYIDWSTRYLPSRIIWPSLGVLVVLVLVAFAIDRDLGVLLRAGYGWAVFGACYYVLWWIYPRGLAFGDVRFSGLLGLSLGYLGWGPTISGLYFGFLAGGIGGALLSVLKIFDRKHYPFGPFMFAGALLGLLVGHGLAEAYTSF